LKNKKVIYTCILNKKDRLKEEFPKIQGYDYICFTDDPNLKSKLWEIRPFKNSLNDFRKSSRLPKMLPHKYLPEYDIWVWVDGRVVINDIREFNEAVVACTGLSLPAHPHRDCVYDEAEYCVKQHLGNTQKLAFQVIKYKMENYPFHNGLYMCGFIIRKNNKEVRTFNRAWWAEYCEVSERDQLSFPYVIWKTKFSFSILPITMISWGSHG